MVHIKIDSTLTILLALNEKGLSIAVFTEVLRVIKDRLEYSWISVALTLPQTLGEDL